MLPAPTARFATSAAQLELLNAIARRILGEIRTTDTPATPAIEHSLPGEAA